jgi:hypothetical protein
MGNFAPKNWVVSCAVGVLSVVAVTNDVSADSKAFHGAFCQIDGFSETVPSGFYDGEGFMMLGSSSTDVGVVTCPLIRDRIGSSTSLANVYVEGRNVVNTVADPAFTCVLNSQQEDTKGTVLDSHTLSKTTIGNVQLGGFTVDSTSGNEGAYSLDCLTHHQEQVYHVLLNENDAATD